MSVQLTICIPIYNCAEFVGQALDSILPQTGKGVEVVVYDGGSTDSTPELMGRYVKAWPNLRYCRGAARGGIDADMAKCVSFANGEYCWLFSGDDVMRPGAIERVLELIKSGDDVYICKHTICSKEMKVFWEHPVLAPDVSFAADFSDKAARQEWFRRAVTTEAFFSFISGLVVRREKWQSGRLIEEFDGSCWGHVARLCDLIPRGLRVRFVAKVWLDQRGENDSFADKGVINRYRIAIAGYHQIADTFFGHDSEEAFHVRRVIRNEFGLNLLLSAKMQCKRNPEVENRKLLDELVSKAYCDTSLRNWFARIVYAAFPYWLFLIARPVYRAIRGKR